jgi:transposase InsO family protein
VIHRKRVWRRCNEVELATLAWVHWYNHERLLARLGYRSPAEMEANYHRQREQAQAI